MIVCWGSVAPADPSHELPRSIAPVAEPVTTPWVSQATSSHSQFEIFVQGSPFGWAFGADDNRYMAMARLGLGLSRTTHRTLSGVFAAYEVSRLSYATFGLHAMLLQRTGWGASVGVLAEPAGHLGGTAGVCYFASCIEIQLRDHDDLGLTAVAMLRLSVAILGLRDELTYLRRTD
jgi:hypothetical protein